MKVLGEAFDRYISENPISLGDEKVGLIKHGESPWDICPEESEESRLITIRELVQARVDVMYEADEEVRGRLVTLFNQLLFYYNRIGEPSPELFQNLVKIKSLIITNPQQFGCWMDRFTTSTNMVHGLDGKMHFWDRNLSKEFVEDSIKRGLKDGAFDFTDRIEEVQEESYAEMDYEDYLKAKGGAYTNKDWSTHSVFATACQFNDSYRDSYPMLLELLSADSIHKPGYHSGWVPGEIPAGYGRPVALGMGEAAFYPPNNSTKHHAGIVVDV